MEGAQTTHNTASDSMKDATILSSPTGNGSSEHNPDGTLRTKAGGIGHRAFILRMDHERRILNLNLGQPSHITRNQQFTH